MPRKKRRTKSLGDIGSVYSTAIAPPRPRVRALDPESEGDSESEDPTVIWRSLRDDEPDPFVHGLQPPAGYNPRITMSQHITRGTTAKEKSGVISGTRSRKVAAAWAHSGKPDKGGQAPQDENPSARVVKYRIPARAKVDFTNPTQVMDYNRANPKHKLGALGRNIAKGSQEVHSQHEKYPIPPQNIEAIYRPELIEDTEYPAMKERFRESGIGTQGFFKTRRKVDEPVRSFYMGNPTFNPNFDPSFTPSPTPHALQPGGTPYSKGGCVARKSTRQKNHSKSKRIPHKLSGMNARERILWGY